MKDIGEAIYVLGIWISRGTNSRLLYLDQEKYANKVFKRFNAKLKSFEHMSAKCFKSK
jgi:hypothetical protein